MKKTAFLSVLLIVLLQSCMTVRNMDDFYAKYENEATLIPIPKFALQWASKESENNEFLKHLNSAKVFLLKGTSATKQERVLRDFESSLRGEHYESLLKLNHSQQRVQVSVLENNGMVQKMLLGISGLQNILIIESKMNVHKDELERALEKMSDQDVEQLRNLLE